MATRRTKTVLPAQSVKLSATKRIDKTLVRTTKFKPGAEAALEKLGRQLYDRFFGEEEHEKQFGGEVLLADEVRIGSRGKDEIDWQADAQFPKAVLDSTEWIAERAELMSRIDTLQDIVKVLEAERTSWGEERNDLDARMKSIQKDCSDALSRVGEMEAANKAALENTLAQRETQTNALTAEIDELRSRVSSLASVEEELSEAKKLNADLEMENDLLKVEEKRLNTSMVYAKNQFNKLKHIKENEAARVATLASKVEEMEREQSSLLSKLEVTENNASVQMTAIASKLRRSQTANSELLRSLEESRSNEVNLSDTVRELGNQVNALKQDFRQAIGEKTQLIAGFEKQVSSIPDLERGILERDSALEAKSNEVAELQAQMQSSFEGLEQAGGVRTQLNEALEQLKKMQAEMEANKIRADREMGEALEIAEMADRRLQLVNHRAAKMEEELRACRSRDKGELQMKDYTSIPIQPFALCSPLFTIPEECEVQYEVGLDAGVNKKNEDGEAAMLTGENASRFHPLDGLIRGVTCTQIWGPCVWGSDLLDWCFIVMMRQPLLRLLLLIYFLMLHVAAIA